LKPRYQDYQFNAVAQQLYDFVWGDFLRLVRRSGQDGHLRRKTQARKESTLGDDGLHPVCHNSSFSHPFMPHLDGGALVIDGIWDREKNEFLDFAPLPQAMAF